MENPYWIISEQILNNVIICGESSLKDYPKLKDLLIQFHTTKLEQLGDISISDSIELWERILGQFNLTLRIKDVVLHAFEKDLLNVHEEMYPEWLNLGSARINRRNERCLIHLEKLTVMRGCLLKILNNPEEYGCLKKLSNNAVLLESLNDKCSRNTTNLCYHRAKLLHGALNKLLKYCQWKEANSTKRDCNDDKILKIQVASEQASKQKVNDLNVIQCRKSQDIILKCGVVIDPATGKLCHLSSEDYIKLRTNDMCLIALHKYGLRFKEEEKFSSLMEQIGTAAVTIDLLEVKHSSPVQIVRNAKGSTRGASFILYNSARLETLLRTFESRSREGFYVPLPELQSISWDLLNKEEEWEMVFVYLLGFPDLIERCGQRLIEGQCPLHLVVKFLQQFIALFSIYYHRIRILLKKHDHLMPLVHARIYFIKAIRIVLNKILDLFDIEAINFM